MEKVHIICFGNLYQGDDGFGIHVCNRLHEINLPEQVSIYDGGILGHRALHYFENCDRVIVIDAMENVGTPGKLQKLKLEDVEGPQETFSSHAINLNHLFHVLPIIFKEKKMPIIDIYAVEINIKLQHFTDQLTEPIAKAVEEITMAIKKEFSSGADEATINSHS